MGAVMSQSGLGWKINQSINKKKRRVITALSNHYCNTNGTAVRDGWLIFPLFSFWCHKKAPQKYQAVFAGPAAAHMSQQMSSQVMLHTYLSL